MGVEGRRAGLESWGRRPQPPPPLFPNAGGQDSLGLCHRQEAHREHQVSRHRCHRHSAGRPRTAPRAVRRTATLYACVLYLATVAKAYSAMQWTHTPMPPQAERAVTEEAAAEKAAALGLLQPLAELSLDAEELHRATAVAVTYCSAQGASSVADLLECASKLTAYDTQSASSKPGSMALSCDNPGLLNWHQLLCVVGVRPRRQAGLWARQPAQTHMQARSARRSNDLAGSQANPCEETLWLLQGARLGALSIELPSSPSMRYLCVEHGMSTAPHMHM